MTIEHQLIQKIFNQKSKYSSPESAQDLANSLESLSKDIYTDSKRFIYELIQNADDASSKSGKLELLIRIEGDYVVVSHQGEIFSEIDIESVCSVGDGNKKGDENKTGFKGIGFKSVFAHSNTVIINTGNYCFKFDSTYWDSHWDSQWGEKQKWQNERQKKGKQDILKMPWQIIPINTSVPNGLEFCKNYNVSTIIKYHNVQKLRKELFELFSDTQILLFLRSKEACITIQSTQTNVIEKKIENGKVVLKRNGSILTSWLTKTYVFDVDDKTKSLIGNDTRIPQKLRVANRAEISFAIQIEKNKIKAVEKNKSLIFTYLPTSVNLGFPFLVNSSFLTDAGRQQIHQDLPWNHWLFMQMAIKFFSWLSELAETSYKFQILQLVPQKFSYSTELHSAFNRGFEEALSSIAFLPSRASGLLKVKEAVYDKTGIIDFLGKTILSDYLSTSLGRTITDKSFVPYLGSIPILSRIGVKIFGVEDLGDFFNSSVFISSHKIESNFSLIQFLYKQTTTSLKGEQVFFWIKKLEEMPFIYSDEGLLKSSKQIYFPSAKYSNHLSDDISIVHESVLAKINQFPDIKEWLDSLGVKEPTDITFIEKSLISGDYIIDNSNVIEIGRYLFSAYQRGILTDDHFEDLQQIQILTLEGNLVDAQNAFLSDFYHPVLRLESIYENDFYVSKDYVRINDLKSEWKAFFLKIGVKETITWSKKVMTRSALSSTFPDYFKIIPSGAPNHSWGYKNDFYQYRFTLISFIENAVNYDFSVKFWSVVFDNKFELKTDIKDKGISYYKRDIASLNNWILSNLRIFPTTKKICQYARSIYSSNIPLIHDIAGDFLPVLAYKGVTPDDWYNHIPFIKHLELEDYLSVLTDISNDNTTDKDRLRDNRNRVDLIYEIIGKNYLGRAEKLREWGQENKILSKDKKTFYSPSELSVVTIDGFEGANLAYCDEKNDSVIDLMEIFGVKIIKQVEVELSNSKTLVSDFMNQLNTILPLIALVAVVKSKSKKEWITEYNKLKDKLRGIKFYETTEIYLTYGNNDDKQRRSSYADGKKFYYVGNWYSPRVLDGLVVPICDFLKIKYVERYLIILLLDTFKQGVEYLKEKFGDDVIKLIPEVFLNPPKQKATSSGIPNRGYNTTDEDIGRKGELFVFDELKKIYALKYKSPVNETDTGFKVGSHVEVFWRNIASNTTADHDFMIIENGKEIYIDSKATRGGYESKEPFWISRDEMLLMERVDRYLIARVFNVINNPSVKFIRMKLEDCFFV